MSNTKIEWTTKRWNPITGCTPISAGCDHCYARRMAQRLAGRFGYPVDDPFRVTFHPERLELPLHWRKPTRIFVNSMGDLFHRDVDRNLIEDIFEVIDLLPQHIFQILTKRIENVTEYWKGWLKRMPNVWLGVTVENAKHKDRIDILRKIPAAIRFISFEPLLGDVGELDVTGIHWVIVGGETGPGARPMATQWVLDIEKQCDKYNVPFFFKKWGTDFKEVPFVSTERRREFPQTR